MKTIEDFLLSNCSMYIQYTADSDIYFSTLLRSENGAFKNMLRKSAIIRWRVTLQHHNEMACIERASTS